MTKQVPRAAVTPPIGPRVTGIMQVVDLESAAHSWETSPGMVVHGHAFNGQVPGPTIEATVGDTLAVRFTNGLPEPAGIHWHGLPADGGDSCGCTPQRGGSAGRDSLESLIVLSDAGTFCYHIPATTAIGEGLYGVVMVRRLGNPASDAERCLVITAIRSGRAGPAEQEILLVNGRSQPQLAAAAGQPERWRVFNLTGYELRLRFDTHRCTAVGSGVQCHAKAEADCPAAAPGSWWDVMLDFCTVGETVRLEATMQGPGRDDPLPRGLATLHVAF